MVLSVYPTEARETKKNPTSDQAQMFRPGTPPNHTTKKSWASILKRSPKPVLRGASCPDKSETLCRRSCVQARGGRSDRTWHAIAMSVAHVREQVMKAHAVPKCPHPASPSDFNKGSQQRYREPPQIRTSKHGKGDIGEAEKKQKTLRKEGLCQC